MTQERWDIVLKVTHGPLSALGEKVFRGPVLRLGANPGPGGFPLTGYRGLDARQCVLTAYTGGKASVAPVGTNQVRLAPHPHVNWKEIDPISGPEYLTEGCALHLGPVGRGCTIEFVECRRFGVWERGRLASEIASVGGSGAATGPRSGPVPASFDARSVGKVRASTAPFWFLGCLTMMSGVTAVTLLLIGGYWLISRTVPPLGPVEDGYEFYESIDIEQVEVDTKLLQGLEKPFYVFVMAPNLEAAGSSQKGLDKPENWDQVFLQYVTASVKAHMRAWSVFRRFEAIKNEYARVTLAMREAGLPEVFAAIPYTESRYRPDLTSLVCAKGYWQYMPEVALRVERTGGLDFKVRDCRFEGVPDFKWSPTQLAPPAGVRRHGEYIRDERCVITQCAVDDRTDLVKSTQAAIYTLGEAWNDEVLRGSGSAVQLTISSHNAGYDDSRFGVRNRINILPTYKAWVKRYGAAQGPSFYGQNIRTRSHEEKAWNGSVMAPETQHYAYSIVAQHLLAVCYYAQNYPDERAFQGWVVHTGKDGYCRSFDVPDRAEVLKRGGGSR